MATDTGLPRLSDMDMTNGAQRVRRGSLLVIAVVAALGSAAIYLAPLLAELRQSVPFGILFAVLGLAQLYTVGAVLTKPTVRNLVLAGGVAGLVVLFRGLAFTGLFVPDPWQPIDSVIGFTDGICAGLAALATVIFAVLALRGTRPLPSVRRRVLTGVAAAPLAVAVGIAIVVGLLAATDGFTGAGFPSGVVAPVHLAAGQRSTVEYCRPDGVPLAMDIYTPPAGAAKGPAPVALYVHGGGLIFGDRKATGLGASLADQEGALFTPLLHQLNGLGFVVASIDYRLPPEAEWPAQIEDAKCAVRFLRANAGGLGIDPNRIGVWGSSAGGLLVTMLGLTGHSDQFGGGQYADQSSAVGAVVDMFGPADLTNLAGSEAALKAMVSIGFGTDTRVRRSASPINYISPGAPPFLIMQGTQDTDVAPGQSELLAAKLHAAGVPNTLVMVQGAGHSLVTPGQHPSPETLTATVTNFLTSTLAGRS